ncbi:DUF4937 domain-containing protein [Endozoicomonas numazuensis]|uniref:DUF4937 domain-containing protein n=1 Tax=Endozoicomonas numazuensis TaxID=1137799 RepID=A0A081NDH9_9GAMM|nr:DUF4937 domain-containing protein [Endozoicomonas numazuensis]KEQ16502.1 hypothetical protein GZ78_21865 [Endozoicomonas numazuensis]
MSSHRWIGGCSFEKEELATFLVFQVNKIMILKVIRCTPLPDMKEAFSDKQKQWSAISGCNGLVGQLGGWELDGQDAFILAVWDGMSSIKEFMSHSHDPIADRINQQTTYSQCDVEYFSTASDIPAFAPGYSCSITDFSFLRVTDCYLRSHGEAQFLKDQENILNPAMSSCLGMLGGYIAKSHEIENRYLVISFWDSEISHQKYVKDLFPETIKKVELSSYIQRLKSYQIPINTGWNVLPN